MAVVLSDKVFEAWRQLGLPDDVYKRVRRVVVDLQCGEPAVMYVEMYGDERLIDLVQSLDGIEIRGVPAPEASE